MSNLTFSQALDHLKNGIKMQRVGWNGKGMYVEFVPAKDFQFSELNQHFVIKNVNNSFSTWVPSIGDMLANDWQTAA